MKVNIDLPTELRDDVRAYEAATATTRAALWSSALVKATAILATVCLAAIVAGLL